MYDVAHWVSSRVYTSVTEGLKNQLIYQESEIILLDKIHMMKKFLHEIKYIGLQTYDVIPAVAMPLTPLIQEIFKYIVARKLFTLRSKCL